MSYYDVRAHIPPGEGQGDEGGADRFENCVFAWAGVIGILYSGVDPFSPQQLRDLTTPGYHGGENFQTAVDFMEAHRGNYPNLPGMTIETPGDLDGTIRRHASNQWLMGIGVTCDSGAHIVAGGAFGHCAGIAAVRDDGVTLWAQGFSGGYIDMSWAQLNSVYGGGLWVCQAPLPGIQGGFHMDRQMKGALVRSWFVLYTGGPPPAVADQYAWADIIGDNGEHADEVQIRIANGEAAPGNANGIPQHLAALDARPSGGGQAAPATPTNHAHSYPGGTTGGPQ